MKTHLDRIIAAAVLLIVAFTLFLWLSPEGIRAAPDITMTTLQGKKLNPAKFRNRPLLVTFWATDCASCIAEMPHFIQLYRDYNKAGLEIIGVAMYYDRPDRVFATVKQRKLPYPIAIDIRKLVMRAFAIKRPVTPNTFLISPGGRIVFHKIGLLDFKRLRKRIEAMLVSGKKQ